jgi:hypothetical protein
VFGRPPGSWGCPALPPNGCWPKPRGGGEGWPKYLDSPPAETVRHSRSRYLYLGVLTMSSFVGRPFTMASGPGEWPSTVRPAGLRPGRWLPTAIRCSPTKGVLCGRAGRSPGDRGLHLYRTPQRAADLLQATGNRIRARAEMRRYWGCGPADRTLAPSASIQVLRRHSRFDIPRHH